MHRLKRKSYLLAKKKPVKIVQKDLRPISEAFVVCDYIKPAVFNDLDLNQYGAIPKSSTTLGLLDMLHDWAEGTDRNSATIRTVLFDYRETFDLIDHRILIRKIEMLDAPNRTINWFIDFLSNRSQRIKLGEAVYLIGHQTPQACPREPN